MKPRRRGPVVASGKSAQTQATVSAGFVQGIMSSLEFAPERRAALLEHAQIARAVLDDATLRVPLARYTRLYKLLAEQLHDEAFGLFSRPWRPGCFAWLARGALSSRDLGEALARLAEQINLLQDNLHLTLTVQGSETRLRMTVVQPLPVGPGGYVFVHEWLLRLVHGLAAWLIARPFALHSLVLPYPAPAHAADYSRVFAAKVIFGDTAPEAVTRATVTAPPPIVALEAGFATELLHLPVRRDAAALDSFLRDAAQNITRLYRGERVLVPRVRQHLRDALPQFPDLAHTARALSLSSRSLHRKLAQEGSSFRALREALRHELALHYLSTSNRPIAHIAGELGFADSTAFYRAFVHWHGCGPRAWRRHSAAGTAPAAHPTSTPASTPASN